jgi:sphingolipid delta-4 desaturase
MGKGGEKLISSKSAVDAKDPGDQGPGHMRTDFYHSSSDEPHATRRRLILEKHPEIEKLFGNDPRPVPFVIALVAVQLYLSVVTRTWSWPAYFLTCWGFSGAASHALSLMTHELSHNLIFRNKFANEMFGIFCNVGMGIPSSTTFKRYHMEHHFFQGSNTSFFKLETKINSATSLISRR